MADSNGQHADAIVDQLTAGSSRYSFFQSMRLMCRYALRGELKKALKVRPALSFSRPRSEVVDIEQDDKEIKLDVNIAGLYGASSPLPRFYTEDLIHAEQEDQPYAREFIDIFHQRLFDAQFRAELKYQPFIRETDFGESCVTELLLAFTGHQIGSEDKELAYRLVPFVGLFAPHRRSAVGLKTLLSGVYPGISFEVVEHIKDRLCLDGDEASTLGNNNHSLGETALLGNVVSVENHGIKIEIGPIDLTGYTQIIQGEGDWRLLKPVIEAYCNSAVSIELKIILDDPNAKPIQLSQANAPCLGFSSWLLHSAGPAKFSSHLALKDAG